MAYVRKKKFWAPGHGNLHLSLESYTLCRDGNWHLLDTYNQKQPPLVMPLQVLHPLGSPSHRHGLVWQICQLHALPLMLSRLSSGHLRCCSQLTSETLLP